MRTWSVVAEMLASHGRCALVTVAEVRGSAPREPGARMVIAPDGGFRGTIGGGELEWQAIGAAREVLSRDAPAARLDRLTLGPDLGQCCGGSVRLLTEVFDRERLDEVRALAAREAAGPFVTRGRIRPHGMERLVADEPAPGAHHAGGADRPVTRPVAADVPAGGDATRERPSKVRQCAGNTGGEHTGPPVVLRSDGVIVERFCAVSYTHLTLPTKRIV